MSVTARASILGLRLLSCLRNTLDGLCRGCCTAVDSKAAKLNNWHSNNSRLQTLITGDLFTAQRRYEMHHAIVMEHRKYGLWSLVPGTVVSQHTLFPAESVHWGLKLS